MHGGFGRLDSTVGLPQPLDDEVPRLALVDTLGERWNHRLITVEAPGGYGKSTVMAQAIRDNASDPSGVDVHVRCRRTHRSVADVLHEVADAVALHDDDTPDDASPYELAGLIVERLAARSPTSVCVWIDDVHVLADLTARESGGVLRDLVDDLPTNAHLAMVGRRLPPLPLPRLVAADECLQIDRPSLLFDENEQRILARHHGREAADIAASDGWPALSRLALTSPTLSQDYLFDEVVTAMSSAERDAIAIAQIAGSTTDERLDACEVDCDLERLVRTVPLLDRYADGSVGAHDLWADSRAGLVSDERRLELAVRLGEHAAAQGDHDAAIDIALAHELWEDAETRVVDALDGGDGGLTSTRCRRWHQSFPPTRSDRPVLRLLDGIALGLERGPRVGVELVQQAAHDLEEPHRLSGQCAALWDLGTRAWAVGDASIVEPCFGLIPDLLATGAQQVVDLVERQRAGDADLAGDFQLAIDVHRALPVTDLGLRHQSTLETILGNDARSAELVDELVTRYPTDFNRRVRALRRFAIGDPTHVLRPDFPPLDVVETQRNLPLQIVSEAAVRASLGTTIDIAAMSAVPAERLRERVFLTMARVYTAIAEHRDSDAAELLEGGLRDAAGDPVLPGEHRRFMPVMYVLSDSVRAELDDAPLRGHLDTVRALGRAFLAARNDAEAAIGPLPSVVEIFSFFPLSWSIELTCLLAARDDARAAGLLDSLGELTGTNAHRELRHRAADGGAAATGAAALLAQVPVPPASAAHVTLFGEPSVRHDGAVAPIGRSRVSQTLAMLLLRRRVTRDDIAATIWPGDDPGKVSARLRVTLSQLRTVIDPDRTGKEASYRLREHDGTLAAVESDWFTSDVWRLEQLLSGSPTLESTAEAIEIVRPGVGSDLQEIADLATAIDTLVDQTVGRRCAVGEQLLAAGDARAAREVADGLVAVAPLSERAAALSIAASLGVADHEAARAAVDRCRTVLERLDVDPSPTTAMLIRRVERTGD